MKNNRSFSLFYLLTLSAFCVFAISCESKKATQNPIDPIDLIDPIDQSIGDQNLIDQNLNDQSTIDQNLNDQLIVPTGTCEVPPKVQLRRLSRFEYERSLQAHFAHLADHVSQDLPEDGVGYGFDQIGEVLSLTPLHLEKYQLVLEEILSKFFQTSLKANVFEASRLQQSTGASYHGTSWQYWADAQVSVEVQVEIDGVYEWEIQSKNLNLLAKLFMASTNDQGDLQWAQLTGENLQITSTEYGYKFTQSLQKGQYRLTLEIAPSTDLGILDEIRFFGPTPIPTDLLVREKLLPCRFSPKERDFWTRKTATNPNSNPNPNPNSNPDENQINWQCLSQSLLKLAQSAWRRNLKIEEQNRLLAWTADRLRVDQNWENAFKATAELIFISPYFVFKAEPLDPNAENPNELSNEQIATRMAYFLWSSPPNDWLFEQARQGLLKDSAQRRLIAEQMMTEIHADALIDSFADQWLHIRNLKNVAPDLNIFPTFSEDLRQSMIMEMKLMMKDLLLRNAPLSELMMAKYRIIDQNLASHYGVDWQQLTQIQMTQAQAQTFENHPDLQRDLDRYGFIKIDLQSVPDLQIRKGLLGLSGFLTITSMPNRTSPVKRGKWVLEELLCTPPPPPPANVEANLNAVTEGRTLKEKLEAHRADPACAGCHQLMDPIGLGLESYDGIGIFRTEENGVPIEAFGQLIDGSTFHGVEELSAHLVEDRRFARCFVEKVYTFALGRGPQDEDDCHLKTLRDAFTQNQMQIKDLLLDMIASPAFVTQKQE